MVASILYNAQAINITILMTLNTTATEQSTVKEFMVDTVENLLDYCAIHPIAKMSYKKSDIILTFHSDASFIGAPKAKSHTAGYFFLGALPLDKQLITFNGPIHIIKPSCDSSQFLLLRQNLELYLSM